MTVPPGTKGAFSATQAAWRFFNNDHISLPDLVEPLRKTGREATEKSRSAFSLLVHDWSKLGYGTHHSKKDIAQLTHKTDTEYELTTALLVSADTGSPLAPGKPLKARLVVTRIVGKETEILAQGFLVTNVPAHKADALTIATRYY